MILIRKESFFVASQPTPVHGTHSMRVIRKLLPFSMRVRKEVVTIQYEGKEGSCYHSV